MPISDTDLVRLLRVIVSLGDPRFRENKGSATTPRLKDGKYIENYRGKWALSLYRDVHNIRNDIEIAIDASGLVDAPGAELQRAREWLEAQLIKFPHGEHKPHQYKQLDAFRIGLKLADAFEFIRLLKSEVSNFPSEVRWNLSQANQVESEEKESSKPAPSAPSSASTDDQRAAAIAHMVKMALQARDLSGREQVGTAKDKNVEFPSPEEFEAHIAQLWQSDRCALSDLKLDLTMADLDLAPSLDRIDSNGHYAAGNLQIVARFINRWKSADQQDNFLRLIELLRSNA